MGLMFLFGLLVLVGIVLLIVWLVRNVSGGGGAGGGYGGGYGRPDRAIEVARERYARGEITREELERIERDLGR